nr:hypothetical protein Iba_chr06cCG13000 [Ipomoea batatas]
MEGEERERLTDPPIGSVVDHPIKTRRPTTQSQKPMHVFVYMHPQSLVSASLRVVAYQASVPPVEMKKIACIALAATASMSVAMAPEAIATTTTPATATHAPGHAIARDSFATLPIVISVFGASLFSFATTCFH